MITLCNNKECPLKETCHRFNANKDDYDEFAIFSIKWSEKTREKESSCGFFMEIEKINKKVGD